MRKRRAPRIVDLGDAKKRLAELVDRAAAGEEIVIAKAGTPTARLLPLAKAAKPRRPGGWEGQVWIADDFEAPLPTDILRHF